MATAILLALIAASAATLYGLLALWAALGRGPWFVRAAVVAAAIGMLIPVPAYDLAVVFLSQSLAIIAPIGLLAAVRSVRRRTAVEGGGDEASAAGHRFSLTDLFLFTLVAAGIASLGAYLPAKHRAFWPSYVLIGAGAGAVSLAAACAALGRRWTWLRWAVLAVMAPGIGLALRLVELPTELRDSLFSGADLFNVGPPEWFALAIASLTGLVITACLALWVAGGWMPFFGRSYSPIALTDASRWRACTRLAARAGAILLPLAASIVVGIAYFKMLFPLPIPHFEAPDPNGYLVLAKLGGELEQADVLVLDPPSETQIRDFVAANRQRLKAARAALELPHVVPVDYEDAELRWFHSLQGLRQLARGLVNEGKAESLDGRPDAAAAIYLDVLRLGQITARGGVLVDALVGNAIGGIGLGGLSEVRQSISPETARQLIAALLSLDAQRESPAAAAHREAVWQQHAYGWAGRLMFDPENASPEAGRNSFDWNGARTRLLSCDLAIRLYRADHGKLPERLERLVPTYLRELPTDPFSGRPPVYRPGGEAFLLYSIGPDRKDDGGQPTDVPAGEGDVVLGP
ncbi:MAG TPA: hypothetical protein VMV10_04420 [Pirellulales bacterium]|nr:hypothetical protein [Pirellulales bacterium]